MEPRSNEGKNMNRNDLEWLRDQPLDVKIELMQNHLSLCQVIANEIMQEEVHHLAGQRYSRDKPHDGRYSRWSVNPGSIRIGDTKLRVDVPRVMDTVDKRCVPLKSYEQMHNLDAATEQLARAVLVGLSMRDYEGVIDHLGAGFGLKKSEVSRRFKEVTKAKVKEFVERDLSHELFVAIFIDGKTFGGEQVIIALGVTEDGRKIPMAFIQSHSERAEPVMGMLRDIQSRGVDLSQMLFIVDGSKGFRKAIKEVVGPDTLIQRCTYHKLENIKSYLPQEEHDKAKQDYYEALEKDSYEDARNGLLYLEANLRQKNISAANSIMEAIDEILTLHRLKAPPKLRKHFRSTNCIESLNSQLAKYTWKVKNWSSSDQRYRWMAAALLETEKKMKRIREYKKIPELKKALLLYYSNGTNSGISTKVGT